MWNVNSISPHGLPYDCAPTRSGGRQENSLEKAFMPVSRQCPLPLVRFSISFYLVRYSPSLLSLTAGEMAYPQDDTSATRSLIQEHLGKLEDHVHTYYLSINRESTLPPSHSSP